MSEEVEWEELTEEVVLCFPAGTVFQKDLTQRLIVSVGGSDFCSGWGIPQDKTEIEAKLLIERAFEYKREVGRHVRYKARITSKNAPVQLLLACTRPLHNKWFRREIPKPAHEFADVYDQVSSDVGDIDLFLVDSLSTVAEAREPLPHLFQLFGVGL